MNLVWQLKFIYSRQNVSHSNWTALITSPSDRLWSALDCFLKYSVRFLDNRQRNSKKHNIIIPSCQSDFANKRDIQLWWYPHFNYWEVKVVSKPFIIPQVKDKLHSQSKSYVPYEFTYTSITHYTEQMTRRLSKIITEHCLAVLWKGTVWNMSSTVLQCMIDSGQEDDKATAFRMVLTTPTTFSKGSRKWLLITSEAIVRIMQTTKSVPTAEVRITIN